MEKINHSNFLVTIAIISLIIVYLSVSGCTDIHAEGSTDQDVKGMNTPAAQPDPHDTKTILQDSTTSSGTAPVRITIHSAYRTGEIRDANPIPGNVFVVVNMTIDNLDETEPFTVNERNMSITGGGSITQKLHTKLSNPFTWDPIPPKSSRTGEVVFGVKARTEQFTLTLKDEQGTIMVREPIGAIPSRDYGGSSEGDVVESDVSLGITINSAIKTNEIDDIPPNAGNVFVVVNMTIDNLDETDTFVADETTLDITGGMLIPKKFHDSLADPFTYGAISPKSSRTGEMVFGVTESTDQFNVMLRNDDGEVIFIEPIGTIPFRDYGGSTDSETKESDMSMEITIHSAIITREIGDNQPNPGNKFVIITMTIDNLDETDAFVADETTIDIAGGGPVTQKLHDSLADPFTYGAIPPKSSRTGEMVFGVTESTDQFDVMLRNDAGEVIFTKPVDSITEGVYSASPAG